MIPTFHKDYIEFTTTKNCLIDFRRCTMIFSANDSFISKYKGMNV